MESGYLSVYLGHRSLLVDALDPLEVSHAVLAVDLGINLVAKVSLAVIQATALDADNISHSLGHRVKAGAASTAEEVTVVLARVTVDIKVLGLA